MYILEAHWVEKDLDGWPIGENFRIPKHKNIEDRINVAKMFINDYSWNIPTVVDSFENDFNNKYKSWPDRVYIINENKLVYYSNVNEDGSRETSWTNEILRL